MSLKDNQLLGFNASVEDIEEAQLRLLSEIFKRGLEHKLQFVLMVKRKGEVCNRRHVIDLTHQEVLDILKARELDK